MKMGTKLKDFDFVNDIRRQSPYNIEFVFIFDKPPKSGRIDTGTFTERIQKLVKTIPNAAELVINGMVVNTDEKRCVIEYELYLAG